MAPQGLQANASPAGSTVQYTVEVMSKRQKWVFRLLLILWVCSFISFWRWWLQGAHVITLPGFILNSVLLLWFTGQVGWFLFFVNRMREPNPVCALPRGRVAIVVTKAPSEPWDVVRETLEAMLAQAFPMPYDVWLADEDPSRETYAWCAAHGVNVSCRKGVTGYHNQKWPRRTRCKEGNLAFFYDKFGYANYDFVVQLDADHVPSPTYLREMIRPFADPAVGYVAAPSICDKNAADSWAARARLYAEGGIHGALQAGYSGGFAPMCIGSHYGVRTRALKQAGGLGPELAEDHSTTMLLAAAGWKGAFAFRADARGDGPACLADLVTQEFQWSRSLANILLNWTPRYWSRLASHLKFQFGFVQLWYFFLASAMLAGHALPVVALVTRTPWADVSLPHYYALSVGLLLVATAIGDWIGQQGWFRPREAKLFTWEVVLFHLIKWPWVLLGVLYAVADTITKKEFAFKVTPKGVRGARPLPSSVLAPYTAIAVIEAGIAILIRDAGRANGYYYLALTYSLSYVAAVVAITALHVYENRSWLRLPALHEAARGLSRRLSAAVAAEPPAVSLASDHRTSALALVGRPALHVALVLVTTAWALSLRWEVMVAAVLPAPPQDVLVVAGPARE